MCYGNSVSSSTDSTNRQYAGCAITQSSLSLPHVVMMPLSQSPMAWFMSELKQCYTVQ